MDEKLKIIGSVEVQNLTKNKITKSQTASSFKPLKKMSSHLGETSTFWNPKEFLSHKKQMSSKEISSFNHIEEDNSPDNHYHRTMQNLNFSSNAKVVNKTTSMLFANSVQQPTSEQETDVNTRSIQKRQSMEMMIGVGTERKL